MEKINGTCGVCGEEFRDKAVTKCPGCDTPHHDECWQYHGGCTIFGCEHAPAFKKPEVIPSAKPQGVVIGFRQLSVALYIAIGIFSFVLGPILIHMVRLNDIVTSDQSVGIMFSDGVEAGIDVSFRYDLPSGDEEMRLLHSVYGSQQAILKQLIRPEVEKAIHLAGRSMSSMEVYEGGRSKLVEAISQNLANSSNLRWFGIKVSDFTIIGAIRYSATFEYMIQMKAKAKAEVASAKLDLEMAKLARDVAMMKLEIEKSKRVYRTHIPATIK